jgi:arginine/lysine/ornithine decarboxylase
MASSKMAPYLAALLTPHQLFDLIENIKLESLGRTWKARQERIDRLLDLLRHFRRNRPLQQNVPHRAEQYRSAPMCAGIEQRHTNRPIAARLHNRRIREMIDMDNATRD